MADLRLFASTSNLVRFTLKNRTTGQGLTGLTTATSGLIISTIADNEAAAVTYTQAGSTIETISTLGTFATPTATKCRFKQVDAVNHPGLYEFQFADARFAVASSKRLVISVNDAEATILDADYEIELVQFNPFDAVRLGLTALPNAAAEAAGGLYTRGAGTGQINQSAAGQIDVDAKKINAVATSSVTTINANLGQTQPVNFTGTAGSALVRSDAVDIAGVVPGSATIGTVTTVTNQLTAAQVATGIFQDTTAGDFTVSGSIGKSLFTAGAVPGAVGGLFIAGTNAATTITTALTTAFTGNLTGNVGGNVTGSVGSVVGIRVKKNAALANFAFLMFDSSGNEKTGLTITSTVRLDNAAFAPTTNSATEVGGGVYTIDLAAADTNGSTAMFSFAAAGARTTWIFLAPQP